MAAPRLNVIRIYPIINKNITKTLQNQISDFYINAVLKGDLKNGEELPSHRELSEAIKVSPTIALNAYTTLRNSRYFLGEPGKGIVIIYKELKINIYILIKEFYDIVSLFSDNKKIDISSVYDENVIHIDNTLSLSYNPIKKRHNIIDMRDSLINNIVFPIIGHINSLEVSEVIINIINKRNYKMILKCDDDNKECEYIWESILNFLINDEEYKQIIKEYCNEVVLEEKDYKDIKKYNKYYHLTDKKNFEKWIHNCKNNIYYINNIENIYILCK